MPMTRMSIQTFAFTLTLLAAVPALAAGEAVFTLEVKAGQAAPDGVPGHVKDLLEPTAYIISDEEGVCYRLWFVKAIPFEKHPDNAQDAIEIMGEAFPVLGYVKIDEEDSCIDFRDDPIDPGQYVIRGSFQPENGDHIGTSPAHSGFMLFMPKEKDDDDLANYDAREDMWEESLADTEAGHPPILSLQPLKEKLEGVFPRMEVNEEEEWYFLTMNLTGKVGDETFLIPVRLVIDGIGEL